jgi:hypothetical protein
LTYTQQKYDLDKNPHTLYQVAKLHLRFGDQAAGVKVLKEVVRMLPASDPDRAAVQKLLSGQEKP